MAILALEFSTLQHGVAIRTDPGHSHEVVHQPQPPSRHRREIPASELIDQALRDTQLRREDIDLIALGLGPGSYTGIRVAIALAQGWELGAQGRVEVLGLSTLEVLAHTLFQKGHRGRVTVAFDAQKGELHLCSIDFDVPQAEWAANLKNPTWRTASQTEWKQCLDEGHWIAGSDLQTLDRRIHPVYPSPTVLSELALNMRHRGWKSVPGTHWTPVYLREVSFVKAPTPLKVE